MTAVRLDSNNWAIVDGWRLIASGFESEAIALSYISLVDDDDRLTDFRICGRSAVGDANLSDITLNR
jgi:hypothetical protein